MLQSERTFRSMKIELEIPDALVEELQKRGHATHWSAEEYTAELVQQFLANLSLGPEGSIENRPDWQAALERARADLSGGRIVAHEEVERWHRRQPE